MRRKLLLGNWKMNKLSSEAKEFAKTKKSITNKKYVNIRIFEITDEEYKKEDGIPDYNYKQPILIL